MEKNEIYWCKIHFNLTVIPTSYNWFKIDIDWWNLIGNICCFRIWRLFLEGHRETHIRKVELWMNVRQWTGRPEFDSQLESYQRLKNGI